jgi:hypothetical protein
VKLARPIPFGWERWFAWHPVELTDGRIVWLRRVERRLIRGAAAAHWTYREAQKP